MRRRVFVLVPLLLLLGGCATKRDLRDLSTEVESLRSAQVEMLREIQRQNAVILDSLSAQDVRLRGNLTNQLVQIERQLVQIQELTGQGQQRLVDLREQLRMREEALRTGRMESAPATPPAGEPDELFATSRAALERGSVTTARAGFEEFLRLYPQHPLAPEALLMIAESYAQADELQRALEAYGRVLELHPNSDQAPTALFRAALLEVGRGNPDRARAMLNQVISAYPRSEEAALAQEQLGPLDGR
jgi:tol-pal system protein YbgF